MRSSFLNDYLVVSSLTDNVVKLRRSVGNETQNFPSFLYHMHFSQESLYSLHNSGLEGAQLLNYYYKNHEDEWTTWFKDEESRLVEKIKATLS